MIQPNIEKVKVMKYFIWLMQNLANATFFPEPKVAFGKDPLYSKGADFDGYPGRASSSMPQKLYF